MDKYKPDQEETHWEAVTDMILYGEMPVELEESDPPFDLWKYMEDI